MGVCGVICGPGTSHCVGVGGVICGPGTSHCVGGCPVI